MSKQVKSTFATIAKSETVTVLDNFMEKFGTTMNDWIPKVQTDASIVSSFFKNAHVFCLASRKNQLSTRTVAFHFFHTWVMQKQNQMTFNFSDESWSMIGTNSADQIVNFGNPFWTWYQIEINVSETNEHWPNFNVSFVLVFMCGTNASVGNWGAMIFPQCQSFTCQPNPNYCIPQPLSTYWALLSWNILMLLIFDMMSMPTKWCGTLTAERTVDMQSRQTLETGLWRRATSHINRQEMKTNGISVKLDVRRGSEIV